MVPSFVDRRLEASLGRLLEVPRASLEVRRRERGPVDTAALGPADGCQLVEVVFQSVGVDSCGHGRIVAR